MGMMGSELTAFVLCRRMGDKRYLCIQNCTSPEQYSFFSVGVQGRGRASYDALRAVACSWLDLQIFDRELSSFSEPINGSNVPPIVFCEVRHLLERRIVKRIQQTSFFAILFLSLDEIQRMSLNGKIAQETVEIIEQIKQS